MIISFISRYRTRNLSRQRSIYQLECMIHEQKSFEKFENIATIQYRLELNEKLPEGGKNKNDKELFLSTRKQHT